MSIGRSVFWDHAKKEQIQSTLDIAVSKGSKIEAVKSRVKMRISSSLGPKIETVKSRGLLNREPLFRESTVCILYCFHSLT